MNYRRAWFEHQASFRAIMAMDWRHYIDSDKKGFIKTQQKLQIFI